MIDVADMMAALRSHPLAIAAVIFACAVVARMIGRIVFFVFIVAVGAFFATTFSGWID